MPIIQKIPGREGQIIAVWEITETEKDLLSKILISFEEENTFYTIKSEQRKKEWLAVRALLQELLPERPEILYKENGKPYLMGNSTHISISHSGIYVAIALHPSATPGVDIEAIHPRVQKISSKFINDSERAFLNKKNLIEQLCIIWCCKEVLYKIHPEGMLRFKENLLVDHFVYEGKGDLKGTIITPEKTTHYKLSYKTINNYILVYSD
ncbi:MAG TPA: 4'-phosphopantetheinyl transferase superfamily protein [Bacteroidia bacterium]|jgi:4'-phosphopantetheinyl transferase|nr:4'-phosphopantetheinyl transferase superfamily protein [Bacteroidia bacterium]